ncbi:hypothetical protein Nepgr_010736 [Nepenthes gracilis]|uniref:Uncharacterized protein n=1 Tax=Nepenthes gracilis TaxID=150966 RepID=A0AAD3XLP8_NEPGR|nr:hypothetical protein Nepgr_010736 [Nepenthes gracilis]
MENVLVSQREHIRISKIQRLKILPPFLLRLCLLSVFPFQEGLMKEGQKEESEIESFGNSGPVHLTSVDWRSLDHRRTVAASLVQGVYFLELDRQHGCHGSKPHGPIWWTFFNFHLIDILIDMVDSSIFGAVYEYNDYDQTQNFPRYVIALRGTVMKLGTWSRDMKLNLQFVLNRVSWNSRYQVLSQIVENMAASLGPGTICLVGHSQGSATALQVGRHMAKMGYYIDSYLFNPPFASLPIEKIKDENWKNGIRIVKSVVAAGLTIAMRNHVERPVEEHDTFERLSLWTPYLFVNPGDPISSEYIGYFEHEEKMMTMGLAGIERLAVENSFVSLLSGALGIDAEATHHIPSAYVIKNLSPMEDFNNVHGIHQWWQPHQLWEFKIYKLKV